MCKRGSKSASLHSLASCLWCVVARSSVKNEVKARPGFSSACKAHPLLALCRRRTLCRRQVRFQSLTDKSVLESEPELFIHMQPDKTNNTLTIRDSGVGMTKADLVNNLGACHMDLHSLRACVGQREPCAFHDLML